MDCSHSLHRALVSLILLLPANACADSITPVSDLTCPQTAEEQQEFSRTIESLKLRDAFQVPALRKLMSSVLSAKNYDAASIVAKKLQGILYVNEIVDFDVFDELESALNATPKDEHRARMRIALALAFVYADLLNDQASAIRYCDICIEEAAHCKRPGRLITPQLVKARILRKDGQFNESISAYESLIDSSDLMPPSDAKDATGIGHVELSQLYAKAEKHELATEHFEATILPTGEHGTLASVSNHVSYAVYLLERGDSDRARTLLDAAAERLDQSGDIFPNCSEADQRLKIARARLETAEGNPQLAHELLAELKPDPTNEFDYFSTLRDAYQQAGDYKKAFHAQSQLLRHIEQKTAAEKSQTTKTANRMLASQHRSLEQSAASSRNIRNLVVGFSTAAVIFSFIFFRVDSNRRMQKKLHEQERETNTRLSNLVDEKTATLVTKMEERAALEQKLERKRRNEALGQLTGGVAHDINNVLQVIMASNEVIELASDTELNETQKCLLDASNESVNIATQIVQQLLAFARRQRLTPETQRVGEVINSQRQLLKTAIGDRINLSIVVECPDTNIRVDTAQLTASLLNLLTNSAHAMKPTGGEVIVEASEVYLRPDELKDVTPGEYLRINVTDNGVGMDEQQLLRCCEPFFSTRQANEGTGLGLSTVQGFVRQSGGELTVKSELGKGTSVSMYFPVQQTDAVPQVETVAPDKSSLSALRTLLVDDSELVRSVLSLKLESMGMEVVVAASGEAAMEQLARDSNVQFVLSDIHMPGAMDGRKLREKIRNSYPTLPVLLMTGYDDSASQLFDDILRKPFTDDELMEKVSALPVAG